MRSVTGVVWVLVAIGAIACSSGPEDRGVADSGVEDGSVEDGSDEDSGAVDSGVDGPPPSCGDGACNGDETVATCPADCPAVCGDTLCSTGESAASCAADCPPSCGDGACTHDETAQGCAADCPPSCGDGACTHDETAQGCAADCPPSCGDGACTHDETAQSCAADCPSVCSDGFCSADETCASCAQDCGNCPPSTVDIQLVGALIRPATVDGRTWDGTGLSAEQVDDLADLDALLAGHPAYGEVAGFIGTLALGAYAPPDPFGVAELAWEGPFDPNLTHPVATTADNVEDTLSPEWPGPPFPGWINVPMGPTVRVRIKLLDEDPADDDVIGTVELDEADLLEAYDRGGVVGIPVHDQGTGQILFVTLSVTATAPPACNGECWNGSYSACTCSAADPCGWQGDGVCDAACAASYPGDHFDDATDCP